MTDLAGVYCPAPSLPAWIDNPYHYNWITCSTYRPSVICLSPINFLHLLPLNGQINYKVLGRKIHQFTLNRTQSIGGTCMCYRYIYLVLESRFLILFASSFPGLQIRFTKGEEGSTRANRSCRINWDWVWNRHPVFAVIRKGRHIGICKKCFEWVHRGRRSSWPNNRTSVSFLSLFTEAVRPSNLQL